MVLWAMKELVKILEGLVNQAAEEHGLGTGGNETIFTEEHILAGALLVEEIITGE